ncbi:hypothetical protein CPB84DRAFT_1788759 [Gymnopilus junonius]|uniref:Uncharacterized protein n=1 Tax=Gymnopilus junonius TaxID=109634 RepID=A0A9P5NE23_GYMJU|nr:hypothetical protein CPB84DRAFT_1788759 [Gymnopilus junonius]
MALTLFVLPCRWARGQFRLSMGVAESTFFMDSESMSKMLSAVHTESRSSKSTFSFFFEVLCLFTTSMSHLLSST